MALLTPTLSWAHFKELIVSSGFRLFHMDRTAGPDNHRRVVTLCSDFQRLQWDCVIEDSGDLENFDSEFAATSTLVSYRDEMFKYPPPVTPSGVQQVEVIPRLGRVGHFSQTLESHDYAFPETHYSRATKETNVSLSSVDQITFSDGTHVNWINIDHPKLINQEIWDPDQSAYTSIWRPGGVIFPKSEFRPKVEVQVGGTGSWIEKSARTPGDPTYDHDFDYQAGTVIFKAAIPGVDNVRATFYKRATTGKPSEFVVQPKPGKVWLIEAIELHLTRGCVLNDTTIFEKWLNSIPFMGFRASYQGMNNILATSRVDSREQPANGGTAAYPPGPFNGYGVGYDGFRGTSLPVVTYVFPFHNNPFLLSGNSQESLNIYLAGDSLITNAEKATFTIHADEENE